jgi:hypothetical protein
MAESDVVGATAVTERDVEEPILSERDRAAIVVELWLVHFEDDALTGRIRDVPIP